MRIIGFICEHAGLPAAVLAGERGMQYSPDVLLVRLPCSGRVDVVHLLRAFRDGADAVFLAACLEKNCHHMYGNLEARKRVDQAKRILDDLGLDGQRVELFNLASNQAFKFREAAEEMVRRVERIGPNPLGVRK